MKAKKYLSELESSRQVYIIKVSPRAFTIFFRSNDGIPDETQRQWSIVVMWREERSIACVNVSIIITTM